MYDGVINVYKEPGFTSFDVVAKLRGILKQKKIGHTGTLDPDAEGVLVVCLGKATKLCEILTDKDKSYEATMLLGKTTDTEDSSGKVLSESKVCVTKEQVEEAILSFVGEYDQIPPMYSAIKVNGKKLYELAREGIEIERTPRRVVIHMIEIMSMDLPYVTFRVACGKGTYIRSLCRDIGEKLGCGAIMDRLVRNSVNTSETGISFTKENALSLGQIEELVKNEWTLQQGEGSKVDFADTFQAHVIPIEQLFPGWIQAQVGEAGNKKLLNGNILTRNDFIGNTPSNEEGSKCLVYDKNGVFKAIYRYQESIHGWKADKMFL